MNNELVRLQEQEHAEIARILAELTDLIQASAEPDRVTRNRCPHIWNWFSPRRDSVATSIAAGPTFSRGRCSV